MFWSVSYHAKHVHVQQNYFIYRIAINAVITNLIPEKQNCGRVWFYSFITTIRQLILALSSIYLILNVILDIHFRPFCSTLVITMPINSKYQLLLIGNSCTLHTQSAIGDVLRHIRDAASPIVHQKKNDTPRGLYGMTAPSRSWKNGNAICLGVSSTDINSRLFQKCVQFHAVWWPWKFLSPDKDTKPSQPLQQLGWDCRVLRKKYLIFTKFRCRTRRPVALFKICGCR